MLENPRASYETAKLLQSTRSQALSLGQADSHMSPANLLRRIRGAVRRNLLLLLSVFIGAAVVSIVFVSTVPPIFTSEALLILEPRKIQVMKADTSSTDNKLDSTAVRSQVELLKAPF